MIAVRSHSSFLTPPDNQTTSIHAVTERAQLAREEASGWLGKQRSWLYLSILLLCLPLYGIDRDRALDQLYHTGWTYIEGAPGQVHALAQTTDGYLWLGTATGLFRFDGIQFEV